MVKDALNTSRREFFSRMQRKKDAAAVPMPNRVVTPVESPVDYRELWRKWRRARSDEDLESLAVEAREAGLAELEARALEELAVRLARGDWLADNRRPLPGGAYSNLRKA